jgi:N-acyl-D-amino-acid deacylase
LEAAVRKMTSLPAAQLGLPGRGVLAVGAAADLVVLDPDTVGSSATFLDPYRFPVGIETVVVNGAITVEGSEVVARNGRLLRQSSP